MGGAHARAEDADASGHSTNGETSGTNGSGSIESEAAVSEKSTWERVMCYVTNNRVKSGIGAVLGLIGLDQLFGRQRVFSVLESYFEGERKVQDDGLSMTAKIGAVLGTAVTIGGLYTLFQRKQAQSPKAAGTKSSKTRRD